ncbi:hypothetical protein Droror1_Dr00020999 [Drosera rotundifolia]
MESKGMVDSNGLKEHKTSSIVPDPEYRLGSSSASSSSSSLSSDFSFEDPLPPDKFDSGDFNPKEEEPNQGFQLQTASQPDRISSPVSSPKDEPALQSPPAQVMERPSDAVPYRIPSYVFARNKSGTPMEWSVASNESLFSIHTGNMSFTREQFSWLLKSGELTYPEPISKPGDLPKSGQLMSPREEPSKPPVEKFTNVESPVKESPVKKADDVGFSTNALPATDLDSASSPVTPKKPELKVEMNERTKAKPSLSDDAMPLSARHSDSSVQSFAFPVLTSEVDRRSSVKSTIDTTEQQEMKKEQPPQESATPPPPEATQTSWFSCLSCCSRHS